MQHEYASEIPLKARLDDYFTITKRLCLLSLLHRVLLERYFLLRYIPLVSKVNLQGRLSFHEKVNELQAFNRTVLVDRIEKLLEGAILHNLRHLLTNTNIAG